MSDVFRTIHEISVKVQEEVDNVIVGEINRIAIENGLHEVVTLNKKGIAKILSKAQKRKIYYDRESYVCCPECGNSYNLNKIVSYRPNYCPDCGQALDWEV